MSKKKSNFDLFKDEMQRLYQMAVSGSQEAREELILKNIKISLKEAYSLSRMYSDPRIEKEDISQVASLATVEAIDSMIKHGEQYNMLYLRKAVSSRVISHIRVLLFGKDTGSNISKEAMIKKMRFVNQKKIDTINPSEIATGECATEYLEVRCSVRAAINRLNDEDKQLSTMYLVNGMGYSEIARSLGLDVCKVRRHTIRALKRLKENLAMEGVVSSSG